MEAIFLCEKPDQCRTVYASALPELREVAGLENTVYTKADILAGDGRFADTRFLFSTWGMPEFTEEEIKTFLPKLECLFYGAGTVQKFARPFLNCGVRVFSAWAANAVPVAEMAVAQIILANKGYFLTNRLYHEKGRKTAVNAFQKCRGNYGGNQH